MHIKDDEGLNGALIAALGAARGVLCLVGAGGKKSTMYALARAHPGRVALSSTAHMYRYDERYVDLVVNEDSGQWPTPAHARVVAFAGVTDTPQRVGGLSAEQLHKIWRRAEFELLVIKADGARGRWIKAPADYEPMIPAFADTVVVLVAVAVVGRELDKTIAHRPDIAAQVMGTKVGARLTPAHLIRLLVSEHGALKGVGRAKVVPVINMVDDDPARELATSIARGALAATTAFDRVVLAAMNDDRIVDVITRAGRT